MMLPRARTRALCQACRLDLQRIFEKGFSTSTVKFKPLRYRPQATSHTRLQTRHFSRGRVDFVPNISEQDGKFSRPQERDVIENEDEALASQAAAIEALEKEMGKSLEEAMEEDESIARRGLQDQEGGSDIFSLGSHDSKVKSIQELRDAGLTQKEIVHSARLMFGDRTVTLLNDEELKFYKRMYGEPSRMTDEDERTLETSRQSNEDQSSTPQLFTADGEQVRYNQEPQNGHTTSRSPSDTHHPATDDMETTDDLPQDQTDLTKTPMAEIARIVRGDVLEEDEYDELQEAEGEEDDSDPSFRAHPLTTLGKFATSPRTVFPSEEGFIRPIEKIMGNFSNKQLKEMCERTFGGEGLPESPLTPKSGRTKKQVPIPLEAGQYAMGEMEANAFLTAVMPPTYASIMSVLVETRKRLGSTWLNKLLAKEGGPRILDAGSGGAGIVAWREIVQAHWNSLHSSDRHSPPPPPSKTVVLTGSDTLRHRAAGILENTTFIPRLPDYTHTRDRPTLEDERPAQQRKQFDVIIASHSLFSLKEEFLRKQHVQNLWSLLSSEGGVLILIEKGIPRGFEAIAGAREMLLERHLAIPDGLKTRYSNMADDSLHKRTTGMIVAPCTNHERCPMYSTPGLSRGRKDICSFQQRYIRPAFLQRVLGAKDRNHDDVDFSYLSVMKGDDLRLRHVSEWAHVEDPMSAPRGTSALHSFESSSDRMGSTRAGFESYTPESVAISKFPSQDDTDKISHSSLPTAQDFPRSIFPPLKRRGHVTLDLCTPAGKIERWTVPRSLSKQAYRDARKSKWGDLWALGAKTQIPRNLRLGMSEKDIGAKDRQGESTGKGRGRKERLKIKAMELMDAREQEKLDEMAEQREFMQELDEGLSSTGSDMDDIVLDENFQRRKKSTNMRTERHTSQNAADIGKPRESLLRSKHDHSFQASSTEKGMDDDTVSEILADWEADLTADKQQPINPKGKLRFGPRNSKLGKSTKEARKLQREINRERVLRERAEMGGGS